MHGLDQYCNSSFIADIDKFLAHQRKSRSTQWATKWRAQTLGTAERKGCANMRMTTISARIGRGARVQRIYLDV